jgi:hypothetical protein
VRARNDEMFAGTKNTHESCKKVSRIQAS